MSAIEDLQIYQKFDEYMRIARSAVRKAREESRRLGVPNVFTMNGQTYYEMPDGEITRETPPGFEVSSKTE